MLISGVDDNLLDGTQTVQITTQHNQYTGFGDQLDVTDFETVTVTLPVSSIREDAGAAAIEATISRSNIDNGDPLLISLQSSDRSELTAPTSVTIPANEASVKVDLNVIDDLLLDGDQVVTLTGSRFGYESIASQLTVTDHETLSISIHADAVREDEGTSATSATITRHNIDIAQSITVSLTTLDTTEIQVPAEIEIPAGRSNVVIAVDAVDDTLLDGTQSVVVQAQSAGYQDDLDSIDVLDHETLTLTIDPDQFSENGGPAAGQATLTRSNTDTNDALTVQLASDDTTEAVVPSSIDIPAGQASITFDVEAVDDQLLDGTQIVTITSSAAQYEGDTQQVSVLDFETLEVSLDASQVSEAGGSAVTTATIRRSNSNNTNPLILTLSSNDTSEARVPSRVVIPGSAAETTVSVEAIDDTLLDGTQQVLITARANGYEPVPGILDVEDQEFLTISLADSEIRENAGPNATSATITRLNSDIDDAFEVQLANSDPSEISIPATVMIPAGEASVQIAVDAVDDALVDGTQNVNIVLSGTGYVGDNATIDVLDVESIKLELADDEISERNGATTLTVSRSIQDTAQALVVTLANNDTSEADLVNEVTIPAGEVSVEVAITALDDTLLDGTQNVLITGSADGYDPGTVTLQVTDYEILSLTTESATVREDAGSAATTATVTRGNTDLDQPLEVQLRSTDTTEASAAATVTIDAGQSEATFPIDAVDDLLLDGTQNLEISVTADGYVAASAPLEVTDHETISLQLDATSVSENAGPAATSVSVARSNTDHDQPLVVQLSSSDATEATIASEVTIPAGQSSVDVPIDAIDDSLLDGSQNVTLSVQADNYFPGTAQLEVTDHETLEVVIHVDAVNESDGTQAATATVTRENTDNDGPLTVQLASSDESELGVAPEVTIPAGASSVDFFIDVIDDDLLDGTITVDILPQASGYVAVSDELDVEDHETLTFSAQQSSISEQDGAAATQLTVTRSNQDTDNPLTVTLVSDDLSELTVPATVVIPAQESSVTFNVDAVDDQILDGTQNVQVQGSANGYVDATQGLDVTDFETLTLTIDPGSVREDAGTAVAQGTVTRNNTDIGQPLNVTLVNADATEVAFESEVTIPADEASITFSIDAVDDQLLDGTITVDVQATANGYQAGEDQIDVEDAETLSLTVDQLEVREDQGAGATQATITRNHTNLDNDLIVSLTSTDTTEITVPDTVTIPAGFASATFDIETVDDTVLDGTQNVTITASASGYLADVAAEMSNLDHEPLIVTVNPESVHELDGPLAATGRVTRTNTDNGSDLTVTLTSDDTEITIPGSVVIPANESFVEFDIDAVHDFIVDGNQTVNIVAAAPQHVDGSQGIEVVDNPFPWHNYRIAADVNDDGNITPVDALIVVNYLNFNQSTDPPAPPARPAPFYDAQPTNTITPADALFIVNVLNGLGGSEGEAHKQVQAENPAEAAAQPPLETPPAQAGSNADAAQAAATVRQDVHTTSKFLQTGFDEETDWHQDVERAVEEVADEIDDFWSSWWER